MLKKNEIYVQQKKEIKKPVRAKTRKQMLHVNMVYKFFPFWLYKQKFCVLLA